MRQRTGISTAAAEVQLARRSWPRVSAALRRHVSTQLEQKASLKEVRNSETCEKVARRFTLARNSRKHCVSSRCTRSSAG